jgi:hypothetical protein
MKMTINSTQFRIQAGEKVKLKQWPTRVKPAVLLRATVAIRILAIH